MNEKIRIKLDTLPKKPGSYQYRDKTGEIIYVGKAKNLILIFSFISFNPILIYFIT